MTTTAPVVRNKPDWLSLYGFYLWGALFMCGIAMIRIVGNYGGYAAANLIPNTLVIGFALYSLLHWQVGWARSFNVGLNAAVAFLGLLYMTPIGSQLPWFVHMIYGFIVIPVIAGLPAESLQSMPPAFLSLIGLALVAFAVYWFVCWSKFIPATDGSVADLESEELSRNVRSSIRKGIIALFAIGFLALVIAVTGFNGGDAAFWGGVAGASLAIAVAAMLLTQLFPGEELYSSEDAEDQVENDPGETADTHENNLNSPMKIPATAQTSEANLLADDQSASDDVRQLERPRKKATQPKGNVFNKDVTGIALVLFGLPLLLIVLFVAFMITIMSGEGIGTFLILVLMIGGGAAWKVISS